ncbi:MAG: phosphate ABC transporter permease subunit PstC [Pseudomonadota bacterium]
MYEQIAASRLALGALLLVLIGAFAAFYIGRMRVLGVAGREVRSLHSLPNYYGYYLSLWAVLPALAVLALYAAFGGGLADGMTRGDMPGEIAALPSFEAASFMDTAKAMANGEPSGLSDGDPMAGPVAALASAVAYNQGLVKFVASGVAVLMAIVGFAFGMRQLKPALQARNGVETVISGVLVLSAGVAIATTAGIVLSLVFETLRFFGEVSPLEFLFGLKWSAQTQIRPDQVGGSGSFGAVPLFFGTMMISVIAMLVAVPVGLFSAIFLSEYADTRTRRIVKPVLEVLAGVPTVVYGFFALLTVAPFIRDVGDALNGFLMAIMPWVEGPIIEAQPRSALAAGLVMGVMIIPFVSSLSDDVINAVPQSLRDGAYAMGATRSETVKGVILPAALPGIVAAVLLAVSRAIGETMIVVMAAGQRAQITPNPFSDVTTITVQIVDLLTGDTEFDSPKTLSAFALGFMLFLVTLVFNLIALRVVQKYREKYD